MTKINLCVNFTAKAAALKRYKEFKGNRPERLVSGSDDFTMFFWEPETSKKPITRMTGLWTERITQSKASADFIFLSKNRSSKACKPRQLFSRWSVHC